jgi:hypothetical protein
VVKKNQPAMYQDLLDSFEEKDAERQKWLYQSHSD